MYTNLIKMKISNWKLDISEKVGSSLDMCCIDVAESKVTASLYTCVNTCVSVDYRIFGLKITRALWRWVAHSVPACSTVKCGSWPHVTVAGHRSINKASSEFITSAEQMMSDPYSNHKITPCVYIGLCENNRLNYMCLLIRSAFHEPYLWPHLISGLSFLYRVTIWLGVKPVFLCQWRLFGSVRSGRTNTDATQRGEQEISGMYSYISGCLIDLRVKESLKMIVLF